MGSKAPVSKVRAETAEDSLTPSEGEKSSVAETSSRTAQLLGEIADTLGMPTSVFSLRETFNATSLAGSEAANECGDLIRAYTRIRDPEKRRRLLELVRNASQE
ncbi:hypothetical protein U8607_21990 [Methylobacterium durans]|uniref:hypothetical protein n=1 Tax=Methylobacterium durans TaxID=2202825 RepID=UPI002AFED01B|nr:hypothetical protein [Methylobacterium durans]MEA1834770.1 hypothetical protein [Methylobacterium durans]